VKAGDVLARIPTEGAKTATSPRSARVRSCSRRVSQGLRVLAETDGYIEFGKDTRTSAA